MSENLFTSYISIEVSSECEKMPMIDTYRQLQG